MCLRKRHVGNESSCQRVPGVSQSEHAATRCKPAFNLTHIDSRKPGCRLYRRLSLKSWAAPGPKMAGKLLLCAALLLLLTHQAVALKSSARSKRHVQKARNAQRAQRSLLQAGGDAAAPAPAPTGPPLETPEDALTVCSYEEVRKATHCKERKHVFYEEYGAVGDLGLFPRAARKICACTHACQGGAQACPMRIKSVLIRYHFASQDSRFHAAADEECCKLLSEFYSNASTKATRNCW